ncbi:ubiquitin [Clostridium sardiniense]|uniref:Ubiquitin n=1 Tax=Clostridium sardiniense TaxID=29369 RepID=A0ABS7KUS1_CLOSR|nr:ubiquitin [Clostridium sardiniense]MBY0754561.1 ubiquitin [Clostridium sardiniense]MDQ0460838.1 hypothetical protein [Clostridium sardiniense]
MSKLIKTTDANIEVNTSEIKVVEIENYSFEMDDRYPWISIYFLGDECKTFVTEIDGKEVEGVISIEELKIVALNWFFNNVEIVKEIDTSNNEVN